MNKLTTLEIVLQLSHAALLVPLKKTASILGLEPQTIRNRLSEGRFELSPVRIGRNVFFHAGDIAQLIDSAKTRSAPTPTRGRPRKSGLHYALAAA
jgi:predicted DNA-binding transcriptional regulator AlpA